MEQLLLFKPRPGMEEAYLQQVAIICQWAKDGRISWKQFQNFRREAEYNLIIKNRRRESL